MCSASSLLTQLCALLQNPNTFSQLDLKLLFQFRGLSEVSVWKCVRSSEQGKLGRGAQVE
jgi:hypothetical protein